MCDRNRPRCTRSYRGRCSAPNFEDELRKRAENCKVRRPAKCFVALTCAILTTLPARIPVRRSGERVQRIDLAKYGCDFAFKRRPRCSRTRKFSPHNPSPQPFPIVRLKRPAKALGPISFFGLVPVRVESSAKLSTQPSDVFRVPFCAFACQSGKWRCLAFAVSAESASDSFRGNSNVKLCAFARLREIQVHLWAVRRFVSGEANVAIDARKILADPAVDNESWIQFERDGSQAIE